MICELFALQVREQDRLFAKQLLIRTKAKKEAEVTALSVKLEEEWRAVQKEKQEALKEIYEQCLSKVGDGHREAKSQVELHSMEISIQLFPFGLYNARILKFFLCWSFIFMHVEI